MLDIASTSINPQQQTDLVGGIPSPGIQSSRGSLREFALSQSGGGMVRHLTNAPTMPVARAYRLARAIRAPHSAWSHRHATHASQAKTSPTASCRARGSVQQTPPRWREKPAQMIPDATAARHHATARRAALLPASRRHTAWRDERRCVQAKDSAAHPWVSMMARFHRARAMEAAWDAHHSRTALRTDRLAAAFAHRRHARRSRQGSATGCAPAARRRRQPSSAAAPNQCSRADRARIAAEPSKRLAADTSGLGSGLKLGLGLGLAGESSGLGSG
jgi:hypothetical protein